MGLFALVMILLGWSGWAILRNIFPTEIFTWYPYIPSVFCGLGILSVLVLKKAHKLEGKKLVNVYMALKLAKMMIAMIYLLAYFFIVGKDIRVFGFVFATFYAIYIGIETYIFYSIENQIKKEE